MKHKFIYIVLTIFLVCGTSVAQTVSKNLSLADYVSYQTLYNGQPIDSTVFTIADIASWEDSRNGKEYALICLEHSGSGSGVAMVEVTNPGNAVYKKTIRHPDGNDANAPFDVKVYNNILFVAQGVQPSYWVELEDAIDNLGNATAGVHTGDLTSGINIHNMFINKDHELLFLSYFTDDQAIQVYDISGLPGSSPSLAGTIPMIQTGVNMRSHDLYAMETGTNQGRVFDANLVSVTVTDYTWNGSTFSVSSQLSHEFNPRRGQNPDNFNNPFTNEHQRSVHSTWVGQDTDYLFTTVEGPSGSYDYPNTWLDPNDEDYQRANYLSVWDINPINPNADGDGYRYPIEKVYEVRENSADGSVASSYFSALSSEKANSIHNITTRGDAYGDTAFISYYTKGLRVLDVANPANLLEIAYYDVPGFVTYWKPVYNGAFGVDPFLPSGIILISSSEGLYVFRSPGIFEGSIDVNTTWTDNIKIVDDVTVGSNATLTIDDGTTIEVANGASLIINGHLQINGTSNNHVAFDFVLPNSGTQNGIKINSGGTIVATYTDIQNAYKGISFDESYGTVNNCTFEDCEYGLYLYRTNYAAQQPNFNYNTVFKNTYDASGVGVYCSYSSPYMTINEVYNYYTGIGVIYNSSPQLGYSSAQGRNNLHNNYKNLHAISSSNPFLGSTGFGSYSGYNKLTNASYLNLLAQTNCNILAEINWWGSSDQQTIESTISTSSSTVDFIPYLNNSPFLAVGPPDESVALSKSSSGIEELFKAQVYIVGKEYEKSLDIIRSYESSPDINEALFTMDLILQLSRAMREDGLFFDEEKELNSIKEVNKNKSTAGMIDLYLAGKTRKNFTSIEEIKNNYRQEDEVVIAALFTEFMINFNELNDYVSAKNILITAYQKNSEHPLVEAAIELTEDIEPEVRLDLPKSSPTENNMGAPVTQYSLYTNYPNPFNPQTSISYNIPEVSHVKIELVDIGGRVIKTFDQGLQSKGFYKLMWDGNNSEGIRAASGVYLYRIVAVSAETGKSFTASKKMILMK